MQKLTLSVDPAVIATAKRYAKARRTSVSRLVETMLRMVAATPVRGKGSVDRVVPPVLSRLRGSLKAGTTQDYLRHLERKYR